MKLSCTSANLTARRLLPSLSGVVLLATGCVDAADSDPGTWSWGEDASVILPDPSDGGTYDSSYPPPIRDSGYPLPIYDAGYPGDGGWGFPSSNCGMFPLGDNRTCNEPATYSTWGNKLCEALGADLSNLTFGVGCGFGYTEAWATCCHAQPQPDQCFNMALGNNFECRSSYSYQAEAEGICRQRNALPNAVSATFGPCVGDGFPGAITRCCPPHLVNEPTPSGWPEGASPIWDAATFPPLNDASVTYVPGPDAGYPPPQDAGWDATLPYPDDAGADAAYPYDGGPIYECVTVRVERQGGCVVPNDVTPHLGANLAEQRCAALGRFLADSSISDMAGWSRGPECSSNAGAGNRYVDVPCCRYVGP